ncbi:MAG: glycosyltransferase family 2 protein [Marinilabiliaceae bacterium]|nr:glycosyltransferase family 2 protein [Marinilabiliaceae bacterium]MBN2821057.1 glycosyltransferase family 2 protein [Bacteroidales bacterium]
MNNKTVSIIIPIYNTALFLKKCIESCLNQTYPYIDVIAVNDGSTDNSLDIVKCYAEKDRRIIIINKANGGLNSARKEGIYAATGEYLTIVDGDDFLEKDAIEKLVKIIEVGNADIVQAGANVVFAENGNLYKKIEHPDLELLEKEYTKRILANGPNTVCMKLYKTSLLREPTEYPNIKAGQDLPLTIQWSLRTHKVILTSEIVYNYVVARKGSTMSGNRKIFVEAGFDAFYFTFELLYKHHHLSSFDKELTNATCKKLYTYLFDINNNMSENKKIISKMNSFVFSNRQFIDSRQLKIFTYLININHILAHYFVAIMQKINPTLNPHTK